MQPNAATTPRKDRHHLAVVENLTPPWCTESTIQALARVHGAKMVIMRAKGSLTHEDPWHSRNRKLHPEKETIINVVLARSGAETGC